ncbi:hypothetical protein [Taibaiella helva]|uniref:hypothetical protein n=1 Tax=Taibaiella helva TaxID=2301235 RepID=UPI001300AE5F|nr:hypothetical protein [Taibaiella helva]
MPEHYLSPVSMSILPSDHQPQAVTRLTALWALNESGLGGLMFALKIPFTGIFVGGFAVVLIGLIAWYSRFSFKAIMKATVLVLIVKATVSPHAPPPAYLAVAFQGLLGALLYSNIRSFTLASLLLAPLAMLESALQKLIVLTLIYGNSLWTAVNRLFEGVSRDFFLPAHVPFSYGIIGLYLLLYLVWGLVTGWYAAGLPGRIGRHADEVLLFYRSRPAEERQVLQAMRRRPFRRWLIPVLLLLFIIAVLLWGNRNPGSFAGYIVLRSMAMVILLFFVLRPLLNRLILYWLRTRDSGTRQQAAELIGMLPGLQRFLRPSWQLARNHGGKIRRLSFFILSLVILSLYEEARPDPYPGRPGTLG